MLGKVVSDYGLCNRCTELTEAVRLGEKSRNAAVVQGVDEDVRLFSDVEIHAAE